MNARSARILITGGTGQVGTELAGCEWPEGWTLDLPGRADLDIADAAGVAAYLSRGGYAAVVNCAAWTAVDKAEDEIAAAWQANAQGPANLASACAAADIPLVQVSTDYVFSGQLDRPYREDDPTAPQSVYGASKLGGEWAVLTGCPRGLVLRTAWVLSRHGGNFAKTMLRLAADRDALNVVADQVGCPTGARDIAWAIRAIVTRMVTDPEAPGGVYHFVNTGEASWAELARHVFSVSAALGGPVAEVGDIASSEYPTRARRPANSRLCVDRIAADYGVTPRPWRDAVAEVVSELSQAQAEG